MSSPRSDPRSSVSSQPSVTSSSTLDSAYSNLRVAPGESSLHAERRSSARFSNGHRAVDVQPDEHSPPRSSTLLGGELAEEHALSSRRKRVRRSGGFLLEPTFGTGREMEGEFKQLEDAKGKRKADGFWSRPTRIKTALHMRGQGRNASIGSSPLSQEISSTGSTTEAAQDARRSIEDNSTGSFNAAVLAEEGVDEPELSRRPEAERTLPAAHSASPNQGGIDPAQLVQMALSLSESRRRHVSAGHPVTPPIPSSRRVTSAGMPSSGSALQGSYKAYGAGGSLRQHLQQQRRISRTVTPSASRNGPGSRHTSSSYATSGLAAALAQQPGEIVEYQFSPATLARAEKARAAIELSIQYRRLLQSLPPLNPNSSAPGNTVVSTSNVPGTPNVQVSRAPSHANEKHELGRQYNPLQFIRNRKMRARTRNVLDPDIDQWNDVDRVKSWVDEVEAAALQPGYRQQDYAVLPQYGEQSKPDDEEGSQAPRGHVRIESATTKPTRPRLDWIVSPPELLADAYWLEQGDNKSLIEDGSGNRIFNAERSSSLLQPESKEQQRESIDRRRSIAPTVGTDGSIDPPTYEESDYGSDGASERGRKKRSLIPGYRGGSRRRKKLPWNVARARSKSSSGLSTSDDDSIPPRVTSMEENIGPLELHMNGMIDHEARRSRRASPDVASPDTPDKWGAGYTALSGDIVRPRGRRDGERLDRHGTRDVGSERSVSPSVAQADDRFAAGSAEPRSPLANPNLTGPNTPILGKLLPSLGLNRSLPSSRRESPTRKSKRSKFSKLRSDRSKHSKDNIETMDFAVGENDYRSSWPASGEVGDSNRSSLDTDGGNDSIRQLYSRKTDEGLDNRDRKARKGSRDTGSGVTRFFKGGRIGELVRTEGPKRDIVFKRKPPRDDTDSDTVSSGSEDLSDASVTSAQEEPDGLKQKPRAAIRIVTGPSSRETLDRRKSVRLKYHIDNLPTFRHTSATEDAARDVPTSSPGRDHIHYQQLAHKSTRSSRFDRLAPPRIDVSGTSSPKSSRDISPMDDSHRSYGFPTQKPRSRSSARLNDVLSVPGTVGRGGVPFSGLAGLAPSNQRRPSQPRPTLDSKRHWSISDQRGPSHVIPLPQPRAAAEPLSGADLARVRALLLCSGIKARELSRRAHSVRTPPAPFLRRAAAAVNAGLVPVPRKEEHVLAARVLATALANVTLQLQGGVEAFRDARAAALHERLERLRKLVGEELAPEAQRAVDEAAALAAEVTGGMTVRVRTVSDGIEGVVRGRRRRMRWVRRAGWKGVEVVLLGVMWWVWLVVVVVKGVWGVVRGVGTGVAWLLWLD